MHAAAVLPAVPLARARRGWEATLICVPIAGAAAAADAAAAVPAAPATQQPYDRRPARQLVPALAGRQNTARLAPPLLLELCGAFSA